MPQTAYTHMDVHKCFQHAFDRKSRHRKPMYRALQSILDLATQRGYTRADKLLSLLKETSCYEQGTLKMEYLQEIFEFVSPEECTLLIQGFVLA